jgi:hypothetical protein
VSSATPAQVFFTRPDATRVPAPASRSARQITAEDNPISPRYNPAYSSHPNFPTSTHQAQIQQQQQQQQYQVTAAYGQVGLDTTITLHSRTYTRSHTVQQFQNDRMYPMIQLRQAVRICLFFGGGQERERNGEEKRETETPPSSEWNRKNVDTYTLTHTHTYMTVFTSPDPPSHSFSLSLSHRKEYCTSYLFQCSYLVALNLGDAEASAAACANINLSTDKKTLIHIQTDHDHGPPTVI